jgi:hypothetical protein
MQPTIVHGNMDLISAREQIETNVARMRAVYGDVVFDEWAVISPTGVLAYAGPRPETFAKDLPKDVAPLKLSMADRELQPGDIELARQADGAKHDVVVRLGAKTYLLLNHTSKTIDELKAGPRWFEIQRSLFALSERFRSDPLSGPN